MWFNTPKKNDDDDDASLAAVNDEEYDNYDLVCDVLSN